MGSSTAGFPFLSSFFPPHCFWIEIAFKQGTFAKDVTSQSSGVLPWFDTLTKAGVNSSSLWRRRGETESLWQWSSVCPQQSTWSHFPGGHQHHLPAHTSHTAKALPRSARLGAVLLSLIPKWKNWNVQGFSYMPRITQEACGWAGIRPWSSPALAQLLTTTPSFLSAFM